MIQKMMILMNQTIIPIGTQNTHTDNTHTQMNVTHTTDDEHRRGHAPSAQQLGRTMPTRDNEGGGETWDGSEYYMDI